MSSLHITGSDFQISSVFVHQKRIFFSKICKDIPHVKDVPASHHWFRLSNKYCFCAMVKYNFLRCYKINFKMNKCW